MIVIAIFNIFTVFIDDEQYNYLKANLYIYENILRKSILVFYDLNKKYQTKEGTLRTLDDAQASPDLKRDIQSILKVLNLAK